jgi:hypothetical protein
MKKLVLTAIAAALVTTFAVSSTFAQCGGCASGSASVKPSANLNYFQKAPQGAYFKTTGPVYFRPAGNGARSYGTPARVRLPMSGFSERGCCGGGAAPPAPRTGYYVKGRPFSAPQARYALSRPAPAPNRPVSYGTRVRPRPTKPIGSGAQLRRGTAVPPCCAGSESSKKTKTGRKPWLDSLLKEVKNRKAVALNRDSRAPVGAIARPVAAGPADLRAWTRPATAPERPVDQRVGPRTASALPSCCGGGSSSPLPARRELPATGSLFKAPPGCGGASCGGACLSR